MIKQLFMATVLIAAVKSCSGAATVIRPDPSAVASAEEERVSTSLSELRRTGSGCSVPPSSAASPDDGSTVITREELLARIRRSHENFGVMSLPEWLAEAREQQRLMRILNPEIFSCSAPQEPRDDGSMLPAPCAAAGAGSLPHEYCSGSARRLSTGEARARRSELLRQKRAQAKSEEPVKVRLDGEVKGNTLIFNGTHKSEHLVEVIDGRDWWHGEGPAILKLDAEYKPYHRQSGLPLQFLKFSLTAGHTLVFKNCRIEGLLPFFTNLDDADEAGSAWCSDDDESFGTDRVRTVIFENVTVDFAPETLLPAEHLAHTPHRFSSAIYQIRGNVVFTGGPISPLELDSRWASIERTPGSSLTIDPAIRIMKKAEDEGELTPFVGWTKEDAA